jgi:enoyl-CoA hydratase
MDLTGYETLLLAQEGPAITVTLNRPELRNATNYQMERELCRVFDEVNHDPAVHVLVITGAGEVFCAGGDFEYIRQNIADPPTSWDAGQRGKQIIFSLLDCVKPVVAKINGHAIGFGATLALFCDVTFAAEHAKIGDPHVSIGLVAGDGGAVIWPQLVGYARAKEHLFTGEPLLAPEAARIGLINHAVPKVELDRSVDAFVAKLLSMPPRALQWTKASVNIGLKQLAHSIMDASIAYELLSVTSEDHREAMAALKDKRKPKFTGR